MKHPFFHVLKPEKSTNVLQTDSRVIAAIADKIKERSQEAIAKLHQMKKEI